MLDENGLFQGLLPVVPASDITSLEVPSVNFFDSKGTIMVGWTPVDGATYIEFEIRKKQ